MKISPQDIIDKEFRVKFRGFDMAEVDAFLEEVAESFFKLTEENTQLHEKVLALQRELEAGGGLSSQGQLEMPAELGNLLEELKQDTAAINAEILSIKHDRQSSESLEKSFREAAASIKETVGSIQAGAQFELPADLDKTVEELRRNAEAVSTELSGLKEDRQTFAALKGDLEEAIGAAKEAASSASPSTAAAELPADLAKTLKELKLGAETFTSQLADLKKELTAYKTVREDIKKDLQAILSSRFAELEEKLSAVSDMQAEAAPKPKAAPKAAPKKEALAMAEIVEEPEVDTRLPDFEEEDEGEDDSALEFLTEDDILDVDRLRGLFQSALDEGVGDGPTSRQGDDEATADLLFLEDDLLEDDHEPEVTFALDDNQTEERPKLRKS